LARHSDCRARTLDTLIDVGLSAQLTAKNASKKLL
jgi:hypothetical protein